MKLEDLKVTGFDKKERFIGGERKDWCILILSNSDGDRLSIRTTKEHIKDVIGGENISCELKQEQKKLFSDEDGKENESDTNQGCAE